MIKFSKHWKSSSSRRKQRKYRAEAPLHIKRKFAGCHLSKELRKKYNTRAVAVRKNDTVKIMRGSNKKKSGSVIEVNIKKNQVYIQGIDITKKDGTKVPIGINPSNLMLTSLSADDKKRVKMLERKK